MKEVWKQGKNGGCIVSNVKPERHYIEEDFNSEKEYYGGYLIAESIPDMVKLNILAASLDMLEALEETDKDLCVLYSNMLEIEKTNHLAEGMAELINKWRERNKAAINKATDNV